MHIRASQTVGVNGPLVQVLRIASVHVSNGATAFSIGIGAVRSGAAKTASPRIALCAGAALSHCVRSSGEARFRDSVVLPNRSI